MIIVGALLNETIDKGSPFSRRPNSRLIVRRASWFASLCSGVRSLAAGPPTAGHFLVASLGIGMAPAVHLGEHGTAGVASVNAHLLDVFAVARDQGAKPGEVPGAVEVWAWAKRIAVAPS
jgi:hypothetical protein